MKRWNRYRARACAVAAAILLPALADAQQTAAPLPERVRVLDESLMQEQDELLQRVAPAVTRPGPAGRCAESTSGRLAAVPECHMRLGRHTQRRGRQRGIDPHASVQGRVVRSTTHAPVGGA